MAGPCISITSRAPSGRFGEGPGPVPDGTSPNEPEPPAQLRLRHFDDGPPIARKTPYRSLVEGAMASPAADRNPGSSSTTTTRIGPRPFPLVVESLVVECGTRAPFRRTRSVNLAPRGERLCGREPTLGTVPHGRTARSARTPAGATFEARECTHRAAGVESRLGRDEQRGN